MYKLKITKPFDNNYKLFKQANKILEKRILKTLLLLQQDPFYTSLKTHKVNTRKYGTKYSSRVTGDIRIIWDFDDEDKIVLVLLDIGGHTGKRKAYK